ncbi:TonB-dependent receptor domain-containing protein [Mannheimia massilioguelmaensis]|uniref:TonB-dependent receptor domain-containing protein n=1 Tax=Mannheimia massilioguelmaensis TaxID=1604354 RepID=UPI000B33E955|nr:TonB-dependent receptor [Mannheimia massilioguelmaensis]
MKSKTSAALAILWALLSNTAFAETASMESLETIRVQDKAENKAQEGKDQVFLKDQVVEYKSKKEIETYQAHSVSDLLSGVTGVYSADSRNSGALDPNIRGVSGQGRIPVLVDGTEQAITVWRGIAGVGSRNYVDPFLISSVNVEKGPSLDRNLRNGAAGTVKLTTLEVDDIVKPGNKFGVELKAETSNNSIKNRPHPFRIGVDYRESAHPEESEMGYDAVLFRVSDRHPPRSGGRNKFFHDNAYRLAAAYKEDKFEGLMAYAYREKGNYYSGKKGGKKYAEGQKLEDILELGGDTIDAKKIMSATDDFYIPWMAVVFYPNYEVPNTSYLSKSWLGKGKYNLTKDMNVNFSLRHSNIEFGDIMPSRLYLTSWQQGSVLEWPLAHVKQTALSTEFNYNPENNKWLDLNFGVWALWNKSKTNTAGGSPGDIMFYDKDFSDSVNEIFYEYYRSGREDDPRGDPNFMNKIKAAWKKYNESPNKTKNIDGMFNTQEAQAQYSKDNYWGLSGSNKFQIADNLSLSVMANYRHETLQSSNVYEMREKYHLLEGWMDRCAEVDPRICKPSDEVTSTPRYGKRNEFNAGFNFEYAPTDWLILNAGARYTHYKSRDDGLRKRLQDKKREDVKYIVAMPVTYKELKSFTPEERALYASAVAKGGEWNRMTTEEKFIYYENYSIEDQYVEKSELWYRDADGHFKAEHSPVMDGRLNKEMWNEKGVDIGGNVVDRFLHEGPADYRKVVDVRDWSEIKEIPTEAQWQAMKKAERRDHAWSPALGVTILLTDNMRIYARYIESKRMPSIFEDTIGYSTNNIMPLIKRKPEHSKNFELGYVQDLRGIFSGARRADFRLNYFHNVTKNIFDRNEFYETQQYDKRTLAGLELQARYDQGRFFADFGMTYNLKNKLCDKDSALEEGGFAFNQKTWKFESTPECVNGGRRTGFLKNMILPQYSITSNLGLRFFDEKLTLGTRLQYHSNVKDTYEKSMRDAGLGSYSLSTVRWQPVFVVDAFANYKVNENLSLDLIATNLTDRYYLDPIARSSMPAPGRTIKLGLTASF